MSSLDNSNMNYIKLPTGAQMPAIGLGTSKAPLEEIKFSVATAIDVGYRHIDTAIMYKNEKTIGDVLAPLLKSGKIHREDLFIVTKVSGFFFILEIFCKLAKYKLGGS